MFEVEQTRYDSRTALCIKLSTDAGEGAALFSDVREFKESHDYYCDCGGKLDYVNKDGEAADLIDVERRLRNENWY